LEGIPTDADRDVLKDLFLTYGKVRYVDAYEKERQLAFVRFSEKASATAAAAAVGKGEVKLNGTALKGALLTGDEDKKYWADKVTPFVNNKNSRYGSGPNKKAKYEKKDKKKE